MKSKLVFIFKDMVQTFFLKYFIKYFRLSITYLSRLTHPPFFPASGFYKVNLCPLLLLWFLLALLKLLQASKATKSKAKEIGA
jgi:hypothetical protein